MRWNAIAADAVLLPALLVPAALAAQSAPGAANLLRLEGTDAGSGIHYLRLSLAAQSSGQTAQDLPPRFTVECRDDKGKYDLRWFVSFGSIPVQSFDPPFHPTQTDLFPPQYPHFKLKMFFEGYMRSKPFTRAWVWLPSGEFLFCNSGVGCPNMESARDFVPFLNALPGLRILPLNAPAPHPAEVFFQTQPLLDALKKSPICEP
ncbi:MAG: hypothetical protein WBE72_09230 [Terracidiphilus sp.]